MDINGIQKNLLKIWTEPSAMMALLGLILLIILMIRIRKVNLTPRIMAHIGVMLALATVIKTFRLYHLPQGGSITAGSMIPILLLAIFYGPEVGFLAGFMYGIISLIISPYVLHPVQVLFDYPLPFVVLGLAGYFPGRRMLGAFVGIMGRGVCHFISGVVFFASYAPAGVSPYMYSLTVNGIFMGIEGGICLAILAGLPMQRLQAFFNKTGIRQINSSKI